mmetsp:Transcript_6846/g.26720  ORF Transcript_6846/g.26720 Transcript_6846/m.26720 type:complete len:224 (+) Transcript_6846:370-1041(+)
MRGYALAPFVLISVVQLDGPRRLNLALLQPQLPGVEVPLALLANLALLSKFSSLLLELDSRRHHRSLGVSPVRDETRRVERGFGRIRDVVVVRRRRRRVRTRRRRRRRRRLHRRRHRARGRAMLDDNLRVHRPRRFSRRSRYRVWVKRRLRRRPRQVPPLLKLPSHGARHGGGAGDGGGGRGHRRRLTRGSRDLRRPRAPRSIGFLLAAPLELVDERGVERDG